LEYSLNLEGRPTWFATTVSPMLADRVIWVARDITERKQAEQALRERLTFEQVITTISTEFINLGPDEIDAGILHALQVIGEFTGDDRSYVFRFSEDGATMDNTHEWCHANIEPQMPGLQAQPVETLGWSVAQVKRLEVVHIPRVLDLPAEAHVDQAQMQGQGIQSLILVPMVYRGTAVGFVGFDSVRRERTWTEDDIALLRIVGEIFANALEHRRARQALQSAYQTLERRVEERTRELATLNAIAAVVSRSLDLRDILSDALDKTLEITQMGCGGSYRLEGEGDNAYLNPLVYRGLSDEFVRFAGRLLLRESRVQATASTGQPLVWEVASTPAESAMKQALKSEGVELVVSVPLMAKGRLVGAIQLGARETRAFAPEELALLAAIGQQVGMAVENARLYEQAQQSAAFAERSRLARELHDSVTQSLYSLTLYAEAAARMMQNGEHTQAADYLHEMRDTAQEALREMRLLIFQLRPPALEKGGLAAALQARLDAVETRGGIRTKLRVEGDSGAKPIPLLVQEELYHIAQEALNNALKHAHPTQVQIYLRFDRDAVHLEISDDGAGFAPPSAEESGGLGLPGMRERAERIGADLRLQSAPGQGTNVAVRVPQDSTR
jgi:signal transduction histidine kinase